MPPKRGRWLFSSGEKKKKVLCFDYFCYIYTDIVIYILYILYIYICKDIGKRDTGRRAVHTLGAKKGDLRG